jgi:hypothetical protein
MVDATYSGDSSDAPKEADMLHERTWV